MKCNDCSWYVKDQEAFEGMEGFEDSGLCFYKPAKMYAFFDRVLYRPITEDDSFCSYFKEK